MDVSIEIRTMHPAVIAVDVPGGTASFEGVDMLDCLTQLRERLEQDGYLLCCQGARVDATVSGMTRQMSHGMQVYVLTPGKRPDDSDLRDTFAPCECDQAATVEAQRRRTRELLGFPLDDPSGSAEG